MNYLNYPNKTFVLDKIIYHEDFQVTKRHFVIVVAKDQETAYQYLKDKLGFKGVANELVWLMDTNHRTLYDQTGNKELEIQAKIVYNRTTTIDMKTIDYMNGVYFLPNK